MAGRTGYTPAGADFDLPDDINDVYEWADQLIGETVNALADLPAADNWVGRTIWVVDLEQHRVWTGSAWVTPTFLRPLADVVVPTVAATLGTSMADVSGATVTATTRGKRVKVAVHAVLINGNSGGDRSAQIQVMCDGVLLGAASPVCGLPLISGIGVGYAAALTRFHTPSAAEHTWKVQASASSTSAVSIADVVIEVEEYTT